MLPSVRACGPTLFCAFNVGSARPAKLVPNPGILCSGPRPLVTRLFRNVPEVLYLALKTYDLQRIEQGTCIALRCPTQGGRAQPHIPASAAPVSWRIRATPRRLASQDFCGPFSSFRRTRETSQKKLWRCAMPHDSRMVSSEVPEQSLGSLGGCLVEGDPEQRNRERRVRRRALVLSIVIQTAVLASLVLVPLFGKTEHIALAIATPIPPYGHPHRATGTTRPKPEPPSHPPGRYIFPSPTPR